MRHIKLYEYFTDEIDASTRDQFKSSMQEEQAALARIGWEIKWI